MHSRPPPLTPAALSIGDALRSSAPLARLRAALLDSGARFTAVRPVLPPMLLPYVNPGPVDAEGWSLLAANASVAAKLRHLQPRLEQALRDGGWPVPLVRIKVVSGRVG